VISFRLHCKTHTEGWCRCLVSWQLCVLSHFSNC